MDFYDNAEQVKKYMEMSEGYDGKELIQVFSKYVDEGATVLELGSGPGKDFDLLRKHYDVTASDHSKVFVDLLREKYDDEKILQLDARRLELKNKYQALYSNKVLQHLSIEELKESIMNQVKIMEKGGIVFHSFWYGTGEETYDGLRFIYYTEEQLEKLFEGEFMIVDIKRYTEDEENDSVYIVAKKVDGNI